MSGGEQFRIEFTPEFRAWVGDTNRALEASIVPMCDAFLTEAAKVFQPGPAPMTDGWTIMSHESHGYCFCGEIHCGGLYDCQDSRDHDPERRQTA